MTDIGTDPKEPMRRRTGSPFKRPFMARRCGGLRYDVPAKTAARHGSSPPVSSRTCRRQSRRRSRKRARLVIPSRSDLC